jgi:hypothetical protein
MVNEENKICNACETLFIEERTDTYGLMINALKKMEPRWDPTNVRLLFGDLKVMQAILDSTGMDNCLLRGDMWHLMNEVWPHQNSSGRAAYAKISNFLQLMVGCENEKDWNFAYQSARKVLVDDPEKVSKLDAIHNNPNYFAGYILHQIEGSKRAIATQSRTIRLRWGFWTPIIGGWKCITSTQPLESLLVIF